MEKVNRKSKFLILLVLVMSLLPIIRVSGAPLNEEKQKLYRYITFFRSSPRFNNEISGKIEKKFLEILNRILTQKIGKDEDRAIETKDFFLEVIYRFHDSHPFLFQMGKKFYFNETNEKINQILDEIKLVNPLKTINYSFLSTTKLHELAEKEGGLEEVKQLVKAGADVYALDSHGDTPIINAIFAGRGDIVKWFLDYGFSPDYREGHFPLSAAVIAGNEQIVEMLFNYGANINLGDGGTPLIIAIKNHQKKIAKFLIEKGAILNLFDTDVDQNPFNPKFGYKAIHYAVSDGGDSLEDVELLLSLLDNGAAVNSLSKEKETPLHIASSRCLHNVSLTLIENGAGDYINARDCAGKTPLQYAVEKRCFPEFIEMLLKFGANTYHLDKNGGGYHLPLPQSLQNK